jgi:hypothetical protein
VWTGSWTGAQDNPSAASPVNAMIRVICAASTLGARGRTSCKRQLTSSPAIRWATTGSAGSPCRFGAADSRVNQAPRRSSSAKTGSKPGSTSARPRTVVFMTTLIMPSSSSARAHLGDRLADVRHRRGGGGAEAIAVPGDQCGVLVVDEPVRGQRLVPVGRVRQMRCRREHLHVDPARYISLSRASSSSPPPAPEPRWVPVSVLPRPASRLK